MLTGDGQLVELSATVQYTLDAKQPERLRMYAFGLVDPDGALRGLAESSVRLVVGRRGLESLLSLGRREAEREAAERLQSRIEQYGLGLVVSSVLFQDVHPPIAVVDAYRDVSRAQSDLERRSNEAEAYRADAVARAKGRAASTVHTAEGARSARIARALGEADAFRYLSAARASDPSQTDRRLFWEALAEALAGKAKVVLDPVQARARHLIVPDFSFPSGPAKAAVVGPPRS